MHPHKIVNPFIIALSFWVFMVLGACKSSSSPDAQSTTIEFPTTATDFGNIPQGQPRTVAFAFKNTGKAPLVIYSTEASCGCTQREYPQQPLEPGKRGEIKVTYDAKEAGHFTKTITVYHNGQNGMDILTITGSVEEPMTAQQ
ncbi:uncharacterized protein DUF1573 [Breznakibacter xylanolyticus]|uniref:Uncharacterized protein DUF1573 n=1 Tax=Breznakibacter xylanolyticus TaxID=990 RepID=A0A2W7N0F2_9BACT|nr:DUF1573 domain-containing protein [Breznakibacter xylanolyticus]PZX13421.1 uncharacterized protein DUF1573 [Breznakibacter xylanolyticus]